MLFNKCHFCGGDFKVVKMPNIDVPYKIVKILNLNETLNGKTLLSNLPISCAENCYHRSYKILNASKVKIKSAHFCLNLNSGEINIDSILNYQIKFDLKNKGDEKCQRYYLFSFKKEKTYLYKAVPIPPPHEGYSWDWDEFSEIDLYIKPDGTKEFYINLIERLLKMKAFV